MNEAILLFSKLLLILISIHQSFQNKDSEFSYKKGLLVTHWTGCVAPRYMGQSGVAHTYGAAWFDEDDIDWIAEHGFDHLQIDVDVRWWFSNDPMENKKNLSIYKKAVTRANQNGMGVVLLFDVHPFGEQPDPMDEKVIEERALQWKAIAAHFLEIRNGLRFHLGDDEIPIHSNPNQRYLAYYQAIREADNNRFIYIPVPVDTDKTNSSKPYMYSPAGSDFEHIYSLSMEPYDQQVGISFEYFEPEIFIYQKPGQILPVKYPGKIPDFTNVNTDSFFYENYLPVAKHMSNQELKVSDIEKDFAKIDNAIKKISPGREAYLRRFGIHSGLDSVSSVNYIRTVSSTAEKLGFSWCIYDYESGRAIRKSDGYPAPAYFGLNLNSIK